MRKISTPRTRPAWSRLHLRDQMLESYSVWGMALLYAWSAILVLPIILHALLDLGF